MSVRTDVVNLIVNVNGNQAQNRLNDLRKKAIDLTAKMKGLKKGTEEWIAKNNELKQVETGMASLKKQIGLTSLTQKELIAELNKLKALKGSVVPFSAEFRKLEKDIKAVESRLYDVRNGVQGFSSFMSKIKTEVKQFGMLAAGYLGFQFLTDQFKNVITGAGKLSDSLADIRRVTGLTAAETDKLNDSLGKLDTRSSTSSLREIAVVAGKLGVEKESILSFTEALDKLVVALGDELGDANAIAEQLGKIVTVFDGNITGENVTKLGNAFVSLANSGASSAAFIADFDQRLSGIAKSANIGLGALSGLGAGLEEMGGRVESSSTAVQKIVTSIAADIPAAAKIAGKPVKEFNELFANNATEAMLQYAEGLTRNKQSFSAIVASFSDAGEEGARVIEILSKMGQSAEFLRGRIDAGTKGIEEFTDINEAFAVKNETFGAELDKLGKKLYSMATSDAAITFAQGVVRAFDSLLTALQNLPGWIERNRLALGLLITGYAIMRIETVKNIALKIQEILLSKQAAAATILETVAVKGITIAKAAWSVVTALLTLNMGKLRAAWIAFTAVMSTNVVGALVVTLGVAILLIDKFRSGTVKLSQTAADAALKVKTLSDANNAANEKYADTIVRLQQLKKGITDTNTSYESKRKMMDELIRINPSFAKTLEISRDGHVKGAEAVDLYINALMRKARAEAAQSALVTLYQKEQAAYTSARAAVDKADAEYNEKILKAQEQTNNGERAMAIYQAGFAQQRINAKKQAVALQKEENKEIVKGREYLNDFLKAQGDVSDVPTPGGTSIPAGPVVTKDDGKGKDKKLSQLEKEIADFYKDLERLRRESDRSQMDADKAELQRVADKYAELYERAKKLSIDVTAIDQAQANEMAATIEKQTKRRLKESNEKYYTEALQQSQDYHNEWRENVAAAYANGEIDRARYESELTSIDLAEQEARWKIAQTYSGYVDKAKGDEVKEHRKYESDKTKATIAENEKRKQFQDAEKIAKAKTAVLSTVKGSGGELAAKKALLDAQFALETESLDRTSEMYKNKEAEKNEAINDLDKEHLRNRIDQYSQFAQQIGGAIEGLMALANNKGERDLNKEKKRNEEKKKSFKQQLDSKLISEQQYNQMVAAADAELDKKTKELQREQAKREKALRLFNAVISVAQGVAASLAYGGPLGIALAVATGIAGALQIAAISSAPLPELAKGDWIRKGDKHSDKSGGIPAMIERDEAVMSAPAMTDNDVLMVTGTTAQITSALNSRKGGREWAGGAKVVNMAAWKNDRAPVINPELPTIMAAGGSAGRTVPIAPESPQPNAPAISNDLLNKILEAQLQNTEEIKGMKTKLHAVVSIKEFREQETLYNNAKKVSGL